MKRVDLDREFNNYFHELESFSTRSERFYDDVEQIAKRSVYDSDTKILESWLRSAFMMGARITAQDSVDTLKNFSDFSLSNDVKTYNTSQAYEMARESLMVYYTKILQNAED